MCCLIQMCLIPLNQYIPSIKSIPPINSIFLLNNCCKERDKIPAKFDRRVDIMQKIKLFEMQEFFIISTSRQDCMSPTAGNRHNNNAI